MGVAIGSGIAVAGIGSALITKDAAGGASDQYGGTQTVRSSSTAMPRAAEYDVIFDEFMTNYFGKSANLAAVTRRQQISNEIANAKELLANYKASIEGQPRTDAQQRNIDNYQQTIDRYQAQYDSTDDVTPYEQALKTLTEEQDVAKKAYLEQLTGLKELLLSTVEAAMGKHAGTLDEIINKRMAGGAVGPYGADIDKLLAERTGVSFGGADPMQFITGSQQRLLGDLMGAQETGLSNIAITSMGRSEAEKEPAALRYGMERELADLGLAAFTPSNVSELAYLQDLRSMWEPMEFARYTAQPSTETTTTGLPTAQGSSFLDQLQQIMNMGQGAASWAGLLKSFVPTSTPYTAPSVPTSTFPTSFSIGG